MGQDLEEEPLVVRQHAREPQVQLNRVRVEEMLGGLDDADPGIDEESGRAVKEVSGRGEVGVEDREQLPAGHRESVVEVPRLGVLAIGAPDIIAPLLGAEFGEPVTPAIVEHPDLELGVVDSQGGEDGPMENVRALVVRRDEDVDAGELVHRPFRSSAS